MEIEDIFIARSCFFGIPSSYLAKDGQQDTELIHFFYDDDVKQTVVEPGFWSDGKVIAELVGIGYADKKRLGLKMLVGGRDVDIERPAFT